MKEEDNKKLEALLKEYLEKKNLFLYKEIWASSYSFKEKGDRNEYQIQSFIKEYSLATDKKHENYKFWQYVYQKDIILAHEVIKNGINIPNKDYLREEYIEKFLNLYTNNKKENKLLWTIINTNKFLNHIKEVEKLFNENVLSNSQKTEIVNHYVELLGRSNKFNTLENKRIVSVLNESLIKPAKLNLIEEKTLEIETKKQNCIYFEIKIKDLMSYSLNLSEKYSEDLMVKFYKLLPKVVESETTDIIPRRIEKQQVLEGYDYAILTTLDEQLIKNIFIAFVDSYIQSINNEEKLPKEEDSLDCLKFSTIKARKEYLETNLAVKNIKGKLNKI